MYIYIYIYNLNSWRRELLVKRQVFPTSFNLATVFKGNYFVFKQSTKYIYNGLITLSALASGRNSVVAGSNPTQTNF